MKIKGNSAKIVCILLGAIFFILSVMGIVKNQTAEKRYATIIKIVDHFTSSKSVRAENDGGYDSYEEYGIVAEVEIDEINETRNISITRRLEESLPKEGDIIQVKQGKNGKWFEYEHKLFSAGSVILIIMGIILFIIGILGKVK